MLIPVILLAQTSLSSKGENDIDLLWKARALQAVERIEKFTANPPKPLTKKVKYEIAFEASYAAFLTYPEMLIKKQPHNTSYHLFFNWGDEEMLDVLYTYDNESQKLISVGIDHLPKDARIVIPSKALKDSYLTDYIYVSSINEPNNPSILFSLTDPFSNFVLSE